MQMYWIYGMMAFTAVPPPGSGDGGGTQRTASTPPHLASASDDRAGWEISTPSLFISTICRFPLSVKKQKHKITEGEQR